MFVMKYCENGNLYSYLDETRVIVSSADHNFIHERDIFRDIYTEEIQYYKVEMKWIRLIIRSWTLDLHLLLVLGNIIHFVSQQRNSSL
jgi:hypothetical protein